MTTFRIAALAVAALLATTLTACSGNATPAVTIELDQASAATTLEAGLLETLVFSDRMGAAAVAHLPGPVDVGGHPALTHYQTGDVAYRAAEQGLVVFLSDGTADAGDGLVRIGRMTEGVTALSSCSHDCLIRVTARDPGESGQAR